MFLQLNADDATTVKRMLVQTRIREPVRDYFLSQCDAPRKFDTSNFKVIASLAVHPLFLLEFLLVCLISCLYVACSG